MITSIPFHFYLISEVLPKVQATRLVHGKPRTWVNIIIAFDMEVKFVKPTLISSDAIDVK